MSTKRMKYIICFIRVHSWLKMLFTGSYGCGSVGIEKED
jgi:hypothetical protein